MINELGRFNFVFVSPCLLQTYVTRTMPVVRSDTITMCPSSHPVSPFITRHICPSLGRLFPRGRARNKRCAISLIRDPNIVRLDHSVDFVSSGTWDPCPLFSSAYHVSFSGWGDILFRDREYLGTNICFSPEQFSLARFPLASAVSLLRAIRAVILQLGCWCASHGFVGDTDYLKY